MLKKRTLVDLILFTTIIGIYSYVHLKDHQQIWERAKVGEGVLLLLDLRLSVEKFYDSHGYLPTLANLNVKTRGKYVSTITQPSPNIYTVSFSKESQISGSLEFVFDVNTKTWRCRSTQINHNNLPHYCYQLPP